MFYKCAKLSPRIVQQPGRAACVSELIRRSKRTDRTNTRNLQQSLLPMKNLRSPFEMKKLSLVLTAFLLVVSSLRPVFAADVIDASLRMRFNFDAAPVNNVIVDSSPSATHPGPNSLAVWSASESSRSG